MSNSSTVTFGADAKDYFTVTKAMRAELDKLAQKTNRFSEANERVGKHGLGAAGSSRVIGDLVNIGTRSTGAVSKVNALAHVLGSTALAGGIVAAGEAVYQFYQRVSEATEATQKENEQLDRLAAPRGGGLFRQSGEIAEHLKEASDAAQKIRGTALPSFGDFANKAFGGENSIDDGARHVTELESAARADANALVQQYQLAAGIQGEVLNGSQRGADLDKAHAETLLKQAEIYDRLDKPGLREQMNAALDAEAKSYGTQIEEIKKKNDALDRELSLRLSLTRLHQPQSYLGQVRTGDQERLQGLQRIADDKAKQLKRKDLNSTERANAVNDNEAAQNNLTDEQFRQDKANRDPAYREAQRTEARERSAFIARRDEASDRYSAPGGAYSRVRDAYNGQKDPSPDGRPEHSDLSGHPTSNAGYDHSLLYDAVRRKQIENLGRKRVEDSQDSELQNSLHPLDRLAQQNAAKNQPNEKSKDGASLHGKIDHLITTLTALPAKIGVL